MRNVLTSVCLCLFLCCTLRAGATTISGSQNGTIVNSGGPFVDTLGLFGTAGADLTHYAIQISFAYDTADFGALNCDALLCLTGATTISARENVSITVNGVTQTITPGTFALLFFYAANPRNPNPAIFYEDLGTANGLGVNYSVSSPDPVVFGQPIIFTDPPNPTTFIYETVLGSGSQQEELYYQMNVPSATPEPSSFVLLGTGVLAMATVARRRLLRA